MVKNKFLKALLILVLPISLASCYTRDLKEVASDNTKDQVSEALQRLDEAQLPSDVVGVDTVSEVDELFLGDESLIMEYGTPLPAEFEGEYGITLSSKQDLDISEVSSRIYGLTGIFVRLDLPKDSVGSKKFRISYSGSLSGLLNLVSNEIGVFWEYDGREVKFYKSKTRVFSLYTLSTNTSFSSSVSANAGGSASMSSSVTFDAWSEVEEGISSIIEDSGEEGKITVSKTTGTIAVTASPSTLKKVEDYVNKQNNRYARQVVISVRVLRVSLSDSSKYGIDLKAVLEMSSGKASFGSVPGGDATIAATGEGSNITYAVTDGDWNGTTGLIEALSTQGKTSLVTSAVLTTINNKVVPFNNLTTQKYVSGISTANDTQLSTTDIETEEITSGFSMQFLPNILNNGRLLMLFSLSFKELLSLDPYTVGEDGGKRTIQLPSTEERSFMQELVMKSGQTVILTGFENTKNSNRDTGFGDPGFKLLGGTQSTDIEKDVLVVILTPKVIKSPLHPDNRSM